MNSRSRTVSLRKLPNRINPAQQEILIREFESCMAEDRPCVVLDCSQLEQLDRPAIRFILYRLEEAMKRNGDIRIAALQPELRATFASLGLDKLFQVFDDVKDAEESYRNPSIALVRRGFAIIGQDSIHYDAA